MDRLVVLDRSTHFILPVGALGVVSAHIRASRETGNATEVVGNDCLGMSLASIGPLVAG